MTTRATFLTIFLCIAAPSRLLAGDVDVTGGTAADRARLLEISELWLDSYASGDLDRLMSIMHDDALVMPHNQPSSRGTDAVRAYFQSRVGREGVTFADDLQEIRINGDWAYVLGRFSLEADLGPDKPPYRHRGRYLVLYEKVGDDWKMLRDMDNLDPAPAE